MWEHLFGVGGGQILADAGQRIDRIARRLGATFAWANLSGQGPRYWFACPDRGEGSNAQCERDVWAALEAEGLAGPDGLLPHCFAERP